jgi:uncharacterized protein DUF4149
VFDADGDSKNASRITKPGYLKRLAYIRLFLLALWLGAAIFFSAIVAPSAFSVLRAYQVPNAGEIAGTLVTRTLTVVNISGFIVSLFLIATTFVYGGNHVRSLVLRVSLVVMAVSTSVGQWVIAAKMRALRIAMIVPIDQVPADDSRRIAFNNLHGYSVAALVVAMIAALVGFMAVARRT